MYNPSNTLKELTMTSIDHVAKVAKSSASSQWAIFIAIAGLAMTIWTRQIDISKETGKIEQANISTDNKVKEIEPLVHQLVESDIRQSVTIEKMAETQHEMIDTQTTAVKILERLDERALGHEKRLDKIEYK